MVVIAIILTTASLAITSGGLVFTLSHDLEKALEEQEKLMAQ